MAAVVISNLIMAGREFPAPDYSGYTIVTQHRFQPIPGYRDQDRVPHVVMRQTDSLLGLYDVGLITQPKLAEDYLRDYTLGFLDQAKTGKQRLFDKRHGRFSFITEDLETSEAADYTLMVFSWMRALTATTPFNAFDLLHSSVLRVPLTIGQFTKRIDELKVQLGLVAGNLKNIYGDINPGSIRFRSFFRTGAQLAMKLPDDGKDKAEKAEEQRRRVEEQAKKNFNALLGEIQINLD